MQDRRSHDDHGCRYIHRRGGRSATIRPPDRRSGPARRRRSCPCGRKRWKSLRAISVKGLSVGPQAATVIPKTETRPCWSTVVTISAGPIPCRAARHPRKSNMRRRVVSHRRLRSPACAAWSPCAPLAEKPLGLLTDSQDTMWQGTMMGNGFCPSACPTSRDSSTPPEAFGDIAITSVSCQPRCRARSHRPGG